MYKKPLIIAFLGRAGTGKSTAATWLGTTYAAHIVSFANELKSLAYKIHEFPRESLYGTQLEKDTVVPEFGISGRAMLQRLGEGIKALFGEDVWAKKLLEHCEELHKQNGTNFFTIDDLRFPIEVDLLVNSKVFDAYIIKLTNIPTTSTAFIQATTEIDDALTYFGFPSASNSTFIYSSEDTIDNIDPTHIFATVNLDKDFIYNINQAYKQIMEDKNGKDARRLQRRTSKIW